MRWRIEASGEIARWEWCRFFLGGAKERFLGRRRRYRERDSCKVCLWDTHKTQEIFFFAGAGRVYRYGFAGGL